MTTANGTDGRKQRDFSEEGGLTTLIVGTRWVQDQQFGFFGCYNNFIDAVAVQIGDEGGRQTFVQVWVLAILVFRLVQVVLPLLV